MSVTGHATESNPALAPLLRLWAEVDDLGKASSILAWDQETQMPPSGGAARGKVQATLAGLRHDKLVSPEMEDALGAAEERAVDGTPEQAHVREARRAFDRAARIPSELARALAEAATLSHESWVAARKASDFSLFERDLAHMIRLKREEAGLLAREGCTAYDALLDEWEPGMTEAKLIPLFAELSGVLSPIVRAVGECGRTIDESPARGDFPEAAQLAFGRSMARAIGFDFDAGRLDLAPHPFCSGFSPSDVRLTWRFDTGDFRPALFGILHEAGHGLYEQGLPDVWQRTPIGGAVSLGVHESQSRLWENLVGRSRAFWEWALPQFRASLPGSESITLEGLWPALHTIRPSLIRVEADQGTYDLHVAIRFEIERAIFAGELEVGDLPGAWDARYEEFLGVRAPSVADGVLQDIHWSMGGFGYFPTYTLGNLIGAQLFTAARAALGDLDAMFARGEFAPLLAWLRENVHAYGARYTATELVERATGRPLSADDFLADRAATAASVYDVTT